MKDRGAALLMAIISIMMLLLITSVFFTIVTNNLRTETLEEKIIKSYTLAEAGINYTYSYVLNNMPSSDTAPATMDVATPLISSQELYKGEDPNAHFDINSVNLTWGYPPPPELPTLKVSSITVQCTGDYEGVKRILEEQYVVKY